MNNSLLGLNNSELRALMREEDELPYRGNQLAIVNNIEFLTYIHVFVHLSNL